MPNTHWSIAFGDYDLSIDRRDRTYRLNETKTGTVWADGLSLGWVELKNCDTGEITRHSFGDATTFSITEKSGPKGKRILFGLEVHGVPLDVYVIAAEREIQLTLESNRDSQTHTVHAFGLLPSLCSVPDSDAAYLVLPIGEGRLLPASYFKSGCRWRVWGGRDDAGLNMPFVGAVRGPEGESKQTALALLTDSAYAVAEMEPVESGAAATFVYERDPERRRLDLRVVFLPGGDHISIARAYRDKIVGEKNHVTLRKKLRDKPVLEHAIGGAFLGVHNNELAEATFADAAPMFRDLHDNLLINKAVCLIWDRDSNRDRGAINAEQAADAAVASEYPVAVIAYLGENSVCANVAATSTVAYQNEFPSLESPDSTRWEAMEARLQEMNAAQKRGQIVGAKFGPDWTAIACDFWRALMWPADDMLPSPKARFAPLYAVVYHDSVVALGPNEPELGEARHLFLRSLLNLSPPMYYLSPKFYSDPQSGARDWVQRSYAVLSPLHQLTFTAFLTEHRFLTPDYKVEEAVYSDKTRIVINQSDTSEYASDGLHLPAGGFYVRHSQIEAHDALRVGSETFDTQGWRIWRTRDGQPLETSSDIEQREFPGTNAYPRPVYRAGTM